MEKTSLHISGMHCQSCVTLIEKKLGKTEGIKSATVNFALGSANIEYDSEFLSQGQIIDIIKKLGYTAKPAALHHEETQSKDEITRLKHLLYLGAILSVPTLLLSMMFSDAFGKYTLYILWILATPVQFYVGARFYTGAWGALRNKTANMDTLIAMGTSAAYFYSVYVILFSIILFFS